MGEPSHAANAPSVEAFGTKVVNPEFSAVDAKRSSLIVATGEGTLDGFDLGTRKHSWEIVVGKAKRFVFSPRERKVLVKQLGSGEMWLLDVDAKAKPVELAQSSRKRALCQSEPFADSRASLAFELANNLLQAIDLRNGRVAGEKKLALESAPATAAKAAAKPSVAGKDSDDEVMSRRFSPKLSRPAGAVCYFS